MKKRPSTLVAWFLTTVLIFSNFTSAKFTAFASSTGVPDTSWYNSSDHTFTISTADQLAGLATIVNDGTDDFLYDTITLTNDIILVGYSDWTPIGINSEGTIFKGCFDGGEHTVSNLNINSPTSDNVGLFGATSNARIVNLGVAGTVIGRHNVGGLIGYDVDSIIANCNSSVTVTGREQVGGIAGECGSIISSFATGNVKGEKNVGGLVGDVSNGVIGCYATGNVTGNQTVGGLGGILSNYVINSYAIGTVTGPNTVGGLAGIFHTNFNLGASFYNQSTANTGVGLVMNSVPTNGIVVGKTTAEMKNPSFLTTLNQNAYSNYTWVQDDSINNGYPYLQSIKMDVPDTTWYDSNPTAKQFTINTAAELAGLSLVLHTAESNFTGVTVTMANDIDLTTFPFWDSIGIRSQFGNSNYFDGIFDGDGHEISNLWQIDTGLFAMLGKNGVIKNLGVSGALAAYSAGGLVGLNLGRIANCHSSVKVICIEDAGGLVADNMGTITACYTTGDVSSYFGAEDLYYGNGIGVAGGLAGINSGVISGCYTTGEISGTYVAGIAGLSESIIRSCYSTSAITGSDSAGKLVNKITALLYTPSTDIIILGGYYIEDNGILSIADTVGPRIITASGMTASEMATSSFADLLNEYVPEGFIWEQDASKNNGYPTISALPYTMPTPDTSWYSPQTSAQYTISTAHELAGLAAIVNGSGGLPQDSFADDTITLANDIDLVDYESWLPIGSKLAFSGVFEGANHEITNLNVHIDTTNENAGLFGNIFQATIKNLHVAGSVEGLNNVGGLVGIIDENSSIVNCSSSCRVFGRTAVGGLVGRSSNDINIISGCSSSGNVVGYEQVGGLVGTIGFYPVSLSYATGNVLGAKKIGGLVGNIDENATPEQSTLSSFSLGDVRGIHNVGGLLGYSRANTYNCYAAGTVQCETNSFGGFAGDLYKSVDSCYWDSKNSVGVHSGGASGITLGLSTADMKNQSFADTLNLYNKIPLGYSWVHDENKNLGYPYLDNSEIASAVITLAVPVRAATSSTASVSDFRYEHTSTTWSNTNSNTILAANAQFLPSTAYTATIVLTAKSGYRFAPVISNGNLSMVNGGNVQSAVTTGSAEENTLTIVVNYPSTSAVPQPPTGPTEPAAPSTSSGSSSSHSPTPPPVIKPKTLDVALSIDDSALSSQDIMTSLTSETGLNTQINITYNPKTASKAARSLVFKVNALSDAVRINFPMTALQAGMTLKVITPIGSYNVPITALRLGSVHLGIRETDSKNIQIEVLIKKLDESSLQKYANDKTVFPIPVVDFRMTASNGKNIVLLDNFMRYVERIVELPTGIEKEKLTAVAIIKKGDTLLPVPFRLENSEGKQVVAIARVSKDLYALFTTQKIAPQLENHWSKPAMSKMIDSMVIPEFNGEAGSPAHILTRGEFAETALRAMGIDSDVPYKNAFVDVNSNYEYSGAIQVLYDLGIVQGTGDGQFSPYDPVTREAAIRILMRLAAYYDLMAVLPKKNKWLADFVDGDDVSDWAKEDVLSAVDFEIVIGDGQGNLAPKGNLVLAEAAQMLKNILKKSGLSS